MGWGGVGWGVGGGWGLGVGWGGLNYNMCKQVNIFGVRYSTWLTNICITTVQKYALTFPYLAIFFLLSEVCEPVKHASAYTVSGSQPRRNL